MLIYQFQTVRASPRSNVCYLRDLTGKNAKQLPDWLSILVNQTKQGATSSLYAARVLPWEEAISLLKSKSVAAGPVISRAPRLNVRSWMAHWTKTRMRLRNSTMYIRWTNAQTSQAGNPETWTPKMFATACQRPMTAISPLSKYLKGGSSFAPCTFLTIA